MPPDKRKRDAGAIVDILVACRRIDDFIAGKDQERFAADEQVQSAVLYQLVVVGEASKRVSSALSAQHPAVPWSKMAGLRDRLIHGYDVIRLEVVWTVIALELPPVVKQLRLILQELGFKPPP